MSVRCFREKERARVEDEINSLEFDKSEEIIHVETTTSPANNRAADAMVNNLPRREFVCELGNEDREEEANVVCVARKRTDVSKR
jgi:hypothetical protein